MGQIQSRMARKESSQLTLVNKCVDRAIAVIWKMLMVGEGRFRRLKTSELMRDVFQGATYNDGVVTTTMTEKVPADLV